MKLWWPHNEILIASLMMYRDSRDEKYLDWFYKTVGLLQDLFRGPGVRRVYAISAGTASHRARLQGLHLQRAPSTCPGSLIMADQLIGQILEQN